jgi:hypothetical protein
MPSQLKPCPGGKRSNGAMTVIAPFSVTSIHNHCLLSRENPRKQAKDCRFEDSPSKKLEAQFQKQV